MGQYFNLVNETKKEYVCPYCIDGVAKWYEWVFNRQFKVLGLLIRRSDDGGGGDLQFDESNKTVGSWAGDKISLVGDYDSSELYSIAEKEYTNISEQVLEAWNTFIDTEEEKINFTPCDDHPKSEEFKKKLKRLKIKGGSWSYKDAIWDLARKLNKSYITEKDFRDAKKGIAKQGTGNERKQTMRPDMVFTIK